jgi:hypothetical protein
MAHAEELFEMKSEMYGNNTDEKLEIKFETGSPSVDEDFEMKSAMDEDTIDKGLNTGPECSSEKALEKENSKTERSQTKTEKNGLTAALPFIQHTNQNNEEYSEEIMSGTDQHDDDEELVP